MEAKNETLIISTTDTYQTAYTCDNATGRFVNSYSICNTNSNPTNIEVALYDSEDNQLCILYSFVLPYESTFERKVMMPIENGQKIKIKSSLANVHIFIGYAII